MKKNLSLAMMLTAALTSSCVMGYHDEGPAVVDGQGGYAVTPWPARLTSPPGRVWCARRPPSPWATATWCARRPPPQSPPPSHS